MRLRYLLSAILISASLFAGGVFAMAQEDVGVLNRQIAERKGSIEQINKRIGEYQKKIEAVQREKASLQVELELLDNRIAKTELEITETKEQIGLINTELSLLQKQLMQLQRNLEEHKRLMMGVLQKIQTKDQNLAIEALFGSKSLSELFDEVQSLETINADLKDALEKTKRAKAAVEEKQEIQEGKKKTMEELEGALAAEKTRLEEEIGAQSLLVAQTQRSEDAFRTLVRELREEQSFINNQISALQQRLEDRLIANDQAGDVSALSWPIDPSARGISSGFHDPTYPFRRLFEHSGVDLPAPTGTPIRAAASGYVAWARKGRQYGNYVMVIHANGLATLYAHMSRVDVTADQFVQRGSVIGAVGNTGLSTGPHVHFEVRKNGIPVNPINYLTSR